MNASHLEVFRHNLDALLAVIEDCKSNNQILPMLVLVYSGIDIVASLERAEGEAIGAAFRRWAARYILPEGGLECTADDLWGARCGIVHMYTATSDQSKSGRAKEVYYSWGTAKAADLQRMIGATGRDSTAIHVGILSRAFRNGVSKFLSELASDKVRQAALSPTASYWFKNLPKSVGDRFL